MVDQLPSAVVSSCGTYRYSLFRPVKSATLEARRDLCWIMLNPSTADATADDPTIRKVKGFTERAGFDGAIVVNLFAYRSTYPGVLKKIVVRFDESHSAEGPHNQQAIEEAVARSAAVICAWGAQPWARAQAKRVMEWVSPIRSLPTRDRQELRTVLRPLLCIGRTKDGDPRHPLMVAYRIKPFPYLPPLDLR